MAVWKRKRAKEVHHHHVVKFHSVVRVKKKHEHHPSAVFKIQPFLEENGPTIEKENRPHKANQNIIYLPPSPTSSMSAEEMPATWEKEESTGDEQDSIIAPNETRFEDENCTGKEELQNKEKRNSKKNSILSFVKPFNRKQTSRPKRKQIRIIVPQRPRKILFLGDMNCGKSSLISTYTKDKFFEQYHPTILHFGVSDTKVMGRKINIILADTSGRNDFKPLRQCAYFKTDIALLCYSAEDKHTLERIKSYWLPELKEHAPHCPFIIVETKHDLRHDFEDRKFLLELDGKTETSEYRNICKHLDEKIVPEDAGARMAKELGAAGFFGTSARYRAGTRHMIETATKVALKKTRRKRRK